MRNDLTFDLIPIQTMTGAELEPLRCGIPASEALAALVAEQAKALRAEHGPGVVVFLRSSGDGPAARIAELEAQLDGERRISAEQQERAERAEASAAALQQALRGESRRLWALAEKAKAGGNTDAYRACAAGAELWHAAANTAQTVFENDASTAQRLADEYNDVAVRADAYEETVERQHQAFDCPNPTALVEHIQALHEQERQRAEQAEATAARLWTALYAVRQLLDNLNGRQLLSSWQLGGHTTLDYDAALKEIDAALLLAEQNETYAALRAHREQDKAALPAELHAARVVIAAARLTVAGPDSVNYAALGDALDAYDRALKEAIA